MLKNKTAIIGGFIVAAVAIGGATDGYIDPFIDKGGQLEMTAINDLGQQDQVKISKTSPDVTLTKWNGEENIVVKRAGTFDSASRTLFTDIQKFDSKDGKETMLVEPAKDSKGDINGVNIDIMLKEKPLTNIFDLQIVGAENMDFFYQPQMTLKEIEKGFGQPDNVVGSYAVYSKTKKDERADGVNYATGKLFHIYRPKVIDNVGGETWAELSYKEGILTITVPQKFLDTAIYPIKIDPTFGYTTAGASTLDANATTLSYINNTTFNLDERANVSKITAYLIELTGGACSAIAGIYDSNKVLVSSSDTLANGISSSASWINFTITSNNLAGGKSYRLATIADKTNTCGHIVRNYLDVTTGFASYDIYQDLNTTFALTNPLTDLADNVGRIMSVYATYTVPSRTITTANFGYCRTMTATAGGNSGGVATTTTGLFPLIATSTISTLAATSSSGYVKLLDGTLNTPVDIVFADEASCYLNASIDAIPHYFEKYASTTGAFVAHLGVSNISSTTPKVITMYYGNSDALDLNTKGQTYATTSPLKYAGVWDLSVPGYATTTIRLDFPDSTYYRHDGASAGMVNSSLVTGYVGGALNFDGVDDSVYAGGSLGTVFTTSAWIKDTSGVSNTFRSILIESTSRGWFIDNAGANKIRMYSSAGSDTGITGSTWSYITAVQDGTNVKYYLNGVADGTQSGTAAMSSNRIGWDNVAGEQFKGIIDDVRVFTQALSAMDVLTIYNNTKSSTVFWTFGAESSPSVGGSAPNIPRVILHAPTVINGQIIIQ